MQSNETSPVASQASEPRPKRERIGLVIYGADAAGAATAIVAAEAGLDELLVMNVQIEDPEIEQARLSRLIGQI